MRLIGSIRMRTRDKLNSSLYLRDILTQASGNTAAQVLGIAVMPLITRLYSPSDFATLNLFIQLVAGFSIFMTLRFEYLVMLPAEQQESDSVLRLTVLLGGIHVLWLTPMLWMLPYQWAWLHSQGSIADWLWLAPLSAWAISLAVAFQQEVQRRGNFSASAMSEFFGRGAYVVSAILGALALPNLMGLMASSLANASFKLLWLVRTGSNFKLTFLKTKFKPIAKSIRRMALTTSVSNLIALFSALAPMIYIADRYGANALGQYGLVVSTLYLPSILIGQAIGQVYYQRASRLHGDGHAFKDLLIITSRNLAKLGFPLYLLIALISPWAYPTIFGAEWETAGVFAQWMCIAAMTGFLSTPLDKSSIIVGAWWYLTAWHALRAILTAACLISASVYSLPLSTFILLLSLQNALAYCIDWVASCAFASRVRLVLASYQKSQE